MSTGQRKKEYLKYVEQKGNLESYSPIALKIKQVAEDPNASAADLANVILHDHALTTKVLKLANSSYYAHYRRQITTLTHAIVLMGFNTIRNMALTLSIIERFQRGGITSKFDMRQFWIHSLSAAICATRLAEKVGYKAKEEAYVAGFLHDLGRLAIGAFTPIDYEKIYEREARGIPSLQAELQIIGVYHSEVGAHLARQWNFPETLVNVIEGHHRIGMTEDKRSGDALIDIVFIANLMAHRIFPSDRGGKVYIRDLKRQALFWFRLQGEEVDDIIESVKSDIIETAEELAIPVSGRDIKSMQQRTIAQDAEETPPEIKPEDRKEFDSLRAALHRKEIENKLMLELTRAYLSATSSEEVLTCLTESIYRHGLFTKVLLMQVNRSDGVLEATLGYGVPSQQTVKGLFCRFSNEENLFIQTMNKGKPELVVDVTKPVYQDRLGRDFIKDFNIGIFAAVPIVLRDQAEAVLIVGYPSGDLIITDEMVETVDTLAQQAGIAMERFVK